MLTLRPWKAVCLHVDRLWLSMDLTQQTARRLLRKQTQHPLNIQSTRGQYVVGHVTETPWCTMKINDNGLSLELCRNLLLWVTPLCAKNKTEGNQGGITQSFCVQFIPLWRCCEIWCVGGKDRPRPMCWSLRTDNSSAWAAIDQLTGHSTDDAASGV